MYTFTFFAFTAFVSAALAIPVNQNNAQLIAKAIDQGIGFNNLVALAGHVANWVTQAQSLTHNNLKSSFNVSISADETINIVDQTIRNSGLNISQLIQDIIKTIKIPEGKKRKDTFRAKRDRAVEATTRTLDSLLEITKSRVNDIAKDNLSRSSQIQSNQQQTQLVEEKTYEGKIESGSPK